MSRRWYWRLVSPLCVLFALCAVFAEVGFELLERLEPRR
jgi:hypothetical protein